MRTTTTSLLLTSALALGGCPTNPPPADAPVAPADAPRTCPSSGVTGDPGVMGACCYRRSQADQHDAPELRLRYIEIVEPPDPSPLHGTIVGGVLNTALQEETFHWLFRSEGAETDGPITITTGFGRRNADWTYSFSTGAAGGDPDTYLPVTIPATLTGESITSGVITDPLTVPIFDEAGEVVQIELILHSIQVLSTTLSEDRSCIDALAARGTFSTAASLSGYIRVDEAIDGVIMLSGITASLCGVVAGSVTSATYCTDNAQGTWMVNPNSLCDAAGLCHRDGEAGVDCDPATTCNAWYLEANFASHGIDIAP
jgi:hypothetical protein